MKIKKEIMDLILIIGLCVSCYIIGTMRGQDNARQATDTSIQALQYAEMSQNNTFSCMEILHDKISNKPWIND